MSPIPRMRPATRSGSKLSSASSFSPVPTSLIGAPVTARMDSAAPPRESPSSRVMTMPVIPSAWLKAVAVVTASCPVIASTTSRVSTGFTAARIAFTSSISARSIESRPAVSRMTTSKTSRRAVSIARRAICSGVWPAMMGKDATSARVANCSSWSCAAGRCVSRLASRTFLRSLVFSRSAILPEVVVLPDPCSPTMRIGIGAGANRLIGTAAPPSAAISASLTILTTICPGETERSTSAPTALTRTSLMKSLTTGSATSASSSASRISRSASDTSASDRLPRRRSRSNTSLSLLDRVSNMLTPHS